MHFLNQVFDIILHLDVHLNELTSQYGQWSYAILFVIIFCETGLVITPFLPGDSLLFAAGALAAIGSFDSTYLFLLLSVAAIFGNVTNYWAGYLMGPQILARKNYRLINKKHLDKAHSFFEKYGAKTIVYARFLPILRTFAPFVAGIGSMNFTRFMLYNTVAGIGWVATFIYGGYYFGNLPAVKHNFPLVIATIIVISMLPTIIGIFRARFRSRRAVLQGPPDRPDEP
jgi:membrane-associated protein